MSAPNPRPPVSRRRFWRQLLGEALSISEEVRGIPQQSLQDLGTLPDGVVGEMVPVWRAGVPPEIREDGLYRRGKDGELVRAHIFAEHEKAMVGQYACGRNLRAIADHVAQDAGLDREAAFAAVKALFVKFSERGWSHPAAAHVQQPGDRT